jgi:hypothetical protein
LVAQLVFWLRLGDVGTLVWPFVWAYSQAAILRAAIGPAERSVYGIVWAVAYAGLSVLLWLALERSRAQHRGIWARSLGAWFSAQLIVTALAWILASRGAITME